MLADSVEIHKPQVCVRFHTGFPPPGSPVSSQPHWRIHRFDFKRLPLTGFQQRKMRKCVQPVDHVQCRRSAGYTGADWSPASGGSCSFTRFLCHPRWKKNWTIEASWWVEAANFESPPGGCLGPLEQKWNSTSAIMEQQGAAELFEPGGRSRWGWKEANKQLMKDLQLDPH